jgi:hypothetical protein
MAPTSCTYRITSGGTAAVKPFEEILKSDPRNLYYSDLASGTQITVRHRYAELSEIALGPNVPVPIKDYFGTLQDLCLYGWYAYEFYGVAFFLSFTAIEMALKVRLSRGPNDKRMLHELLQEALKKKLISSKAFTHIRGIRETAALDLRRMRRFEGLRKSQLPKSDYLAILQKAIPRLRNAYAHPTGQAIHLPHEAIFSLRFAAEFINQLFPMIGTKAKAVSESPYHGMLLCKPKAKTPCSSDCLFA